MASIRGRGGFRGRTALKGRGGDSRSHNGSRGRGRSRGSGFRGGRRDHFTTARIEDPVRDEQDSSEPDHKESDAEAQLDVTDESSSDYDEIPRPTVRPYNALLQSFQELVSHEKPRRKRRKLDHSLIETENGRSVTPQLEADDGERDVGDAEDDADAVIGVDEIEDDEDASDPFEVHFSSPDENELSQKLKAISKNEWAIQKISAGDSGRLLVYAPGSEHKELSKRKIRSVKDLNLKNRLIHNAQNVIGEFDQLEQSILPHISEYQDVLFGARSIQNSQRLRQITCLHALNHIFKTRDRVIKNNAKAVKEQEDAEVEYRDQGFTRPKVLLLLETRQSCVRAVDAITSLCDFEQQENKKRFLELFAEAEDKFSDDKPEDFRELFEGNDDNEFRLGLKFTRKAVKFFSKFYNSDIIFASPLGLRRAIEAGGPKKKDSDFLSSIEVVIMDQADAMLMQNWEHVEYVFDHLNLQPKDAHGCDFSRVRNWYLDGQAANFRQTIVLSAYLTPELNSLFSKYMRNVAGKTKFQREYEGAIMDIGLQVKQTFSRYESLLPVDDPDARFKYFTTAIVPSLSRYPTPAEGGQGILIFIPSYLDFVRIRNYFATSQATQNISFGAISEYVDLPDVRRARSHFSTGRHSVLLYTGRAHHFRRYHIRGVKRIIMYALPDNPVFYRELVGGYLSTTIGVGKIDPTEAGVRVIFSRWDGLRLERVVGTKRVASMLKDNTGDTFDFI
ncbi:U3 small nucleolar RNA-associated protein 25 [Lepidopterella palustris CBS 459.81]|uniref:U3 small nucleolar RNA-associated protein 25 n=1 Tax=Lepidopterella palustris CBS 459.81 TaxID=1314670 RepID=A0A8E2JK29_9PEZI|nr:U3 small nucleolar RNA-associated protein 25 [Lepidopterella palustris CBS 459.81]